MQHFILIFVKIYLNDNTFFGSMQNDRNLSLKLLFCLLIKIFFSLPLLKVSANGCRVWRRLGDLVLVSPILELKTRKSSVDKRRFSGVNVKSGAERCSWIGSRRPKFRDVSIFVNFESNSNSESSFFVEPFSSLDSAVIDIIGVGFLGLEARVV